MKRNLQDDQWAKSLRDWEDKPISDAWDRPSADMWERVAEDLPLKKSKRVIAWWISSISIMAAISIGVAIYLMFQTNKGVVDKEEVVGTSNNQTQTQAQIQMGAAADLAAMVGGQRTSRVNAVNLGAQNNNNQAGKTQISTSNTQTLSTQISNSVIVAPSEYSIVSDVQKLVQKDQALDVSILNGSESFDELELDSKRGSLIVDSSSSSNLSDLKHERGGLNIAVLSSNAMSSIPTLAFNVVGEKLALETEAVLSKSIKSPWSMDVYTQKPLKEQQHIRSPFIQRQQEKSYSYGAQLNRELGRGFSIHLGLLKLVDVTNGTNRFVRFFDRNNEVLDGTSRISEFSLTTQLGGNDPIDDNVKIERDDSQMIEDQTRLIFEIERKFSLKSISVPIQLSYSIWTEYPFQLSAMLGAKYSRIERTIEKGGVTIINPEFRIRQFNAGRPAVLVKETTSNIVAQGGLRLDVHLSPKLSAVTQLEFQSKSSKLPWRSVGGGSSVRLGLSYSF